MRNETATPIPERPKGDIQVVSFDVEYGFNPTGPLTSLRIFLGIPKTIEKRQNVIKLKFSPDPLAVYDDNDTRYAIFHFSNPPENVRVRMSGEIELHRSDLMTALANWNPLNQTNAPTLSSAQKKEFLKSEKFMEVDDPTIKKIANTIRSPQERLSKIAAPQSIQDTQTAEIETIQDILQWIRKNVKYDAEKTPAGAVETVRQGGGVCQQFSELFVALCRAKGLPAKYVGGLSSYFDKRNPNTTPRHAWAETFISGLGWVSFDPTWMESTSDVVTPCYISLTRIRNNVDLEIENHMYLQYRYKSPAKVNWSNSYVFKALGP